MVFGNLDQSRSKAFGDLVQLGLGIEEAIEKEVGRPRRWQDGAKSEPISFLGGWAKNGQELQACVADNEENMCFEYEMTLYDPGMWLIYFSSTRP